MKFYGEVEYVYAVILAIKFCLLRFPTFRKSMVATVDDNMDSLDSKYFKIQIVSLQIQIQRTSKSNELMYDIATKFLRNMITSIQLKHY